MVDLWFCQTNIILCPSFAYDAERDQRFEIYHLDKWLKKVT